MRRFTVIAAAVMVVAGLTGLQQLTAHAANLPATCATLQTELNAASPGDTVTLSNGGVPCTAPLITYPVTLPNKAITLTGAVAGDGFNGQGTAQLMTGSNVGATAISNLVFENGHSTSGLAGALEVSGDVTISGCTFRGNSSNGAGAVEVQGNSGTTTITNDTFGGTASGDGNSSSGAFTGGALTINTSGDVVITNDTFTDNTTPGAADTPGGAVFVYAGNAAITFSNNTLTGNKQTGPGGTGGGASLVANTMAITGNTFSGNSLGSGQAGNLGNLGGGLDLLGAGSKSSVTQSHNLFENNHVGGYGDTTARSEEYFGGGGEYAQVSSISSVDDTFTGNTVGAGLANSTGAGGGFALQGLFGNKTTLQATNLVATNNSVQTAADGDADGGGIYAGFTTGCPSGQVCPAEIDLFDSTVTANSAVSGPGLSGGQPADIGKVTNSIVYGNSGSAAQLNFSSPVVTSSDSCSAAATAYSGTGNICVNPALVNPAGNDVHETAASPTVNVGNNALIPSGVTTDYAGNARIIGGTVDMGAAEFQPAAVVIPPVPASGAVADPALPSGLGLLTVGTLALGLLGFGVPARRRTRRTR